MSANAIIHASNLHKTFSAASGTVPALQGIAFSIPQGKCIGLLGPNGAGKTTTMRMIMGLCTISSGSLTLFGEPAGNLSRATKARVGLVPQEDNLDPDLSVAQNLYVYGRYFGLPRSVLSERVPQLLGFMKLEEKAKAKTQHLSGGMKRRLIIARALIANPDLVILDEPTTGLDPQARVMIWQRLLDLKKQGKTLLLTTHYMDEAQRLCDDIIIMDGGKILTQGTPQQLIEKHVKGHVFEVAKPLPDGLLKTDLEHEDIGDAVLFYVSQPKAFVGKLSGNSKYLHREANLEDVFLRLTGRKLRAEG